jgi:hypothetical protein
MHPFIRRCEGAAGVHKVNPLDLVETIREGSALMQRTYPISTTALIKTLTVWPGIVTGRVSPRTRHARHGG